MTTAKIDKQLMLTVDNRVGTLAEICGFIADSGINLIAVCAYVIDSRGFIVFVAEDSKKAQAILKEKNYDVREEEVVVATVDNKPGALKVLTEKISDIGVDITLLYGSVEKKSKKSNIVVVSENNQAALAAIVSR